MNFLAHIYLSFDDPEVALGNFIADSIKGRNYQHLPVNIQRGILLHRAIDTYTDTHPTPRISSARLHSKYSHYSRVIVDIFYDHFLARNWQHYHPIPLHRFTAEFYSLLQENRNHLPSGILGLLPYLLKDNWLLNYAHLEGIEYVLKGMNRRTQYRSSMDESIVELQTHYESFESEFTTFFEELITFSQQKIQTL
ncbi:acyl carrier protein phosphodiesterase [Robiginitalea sp.]|nr:acyl carrier protein phosphodiesterase [Robiginitalea sp.]